MGVYIIYRRYPVLRKYKQRRTEPATAITADRHLSPRSKGCVFMIPFGTVECERLSVLATAFVLALWAGGFAAGGSEKIVVTNNCPITLWIHFTEMPYTADINGGKAQKMLPNTTLVLRFAAGFRSRKVLGLL